MPPVDIDGDIYVDGALGPNGGLPFDQLLREGYRVRRPHCPRDYVKRAPCPPASVPPYEPPTASLPSVFEWRGPS